MFKSSSINCSGWKDLCIIILHNYIRVNACKPNVHFPGYSSHWNTKVVYNLFLALRKFDFNEDKLKLEYICSLPKLIQHQSSFVFSFKVVSLLLLTHKKGSKVLNGSLPEFQSYTFQNSHKMNFKSYERSNEACGNSCNRGRVRVGELHKNSWGSFSFFSLIKTLLLIEEQIKARHDFFARRYNIDTWKILNSQQDWVVNSGVMMLDEERHDFGISHSVTCENFRIYWKRVYVTDWKLQ